MLVRFVHAPKAAADEAVLHPSASEGKRSNGMNSAVRSRLPSDVLKLDCWSLEYVGS